MAALRKAHVLAALVLLLNLLSIQCEQLVYQGAEFLPNVIQRRSLQQTRCRKWDCDAQQKLWRAVITDNPDNVTTAVNEGAVVNMKYGASWTLLHLAAEYGHTDAGKRLIELHADKNAGNTNGTTPLHMAADRGFASFVRMLLDQGATRDPRDILRFTPLHLASFGHGYLKYDLGDIKGISGNRAAEDVNIQRVKVGPRADHVTVARILLDSWADPKAETVYRETPLHYVSTWDKWKICRMLIDAGADVNARDVQKETPLHEAVAYAATGVTQVLLNHMADTYIKERNGLTPLEFICRCRQYSGDPTLNPCAPQKCISGEDSELMESFILDARDQG